MSEVLKIAQLGDPILKKTALEIEDVTQSAIQNLIDALLTTAQSANGVGLAAPQVAQSYRLLIVASRPNPRYPNAPLMEPTPMLNPKLIDVSNEMVKGWEGCLSIPNFRGLVPRHQTVEIEYQDRKGKLQRQVLNDFVARILQHELDHLNGMVFLDRLESPLDLYTEREYEKLCQESVT